MRKLYLPQELYDEEINDSRAVTGPYIAVDAYLTGLFAADDAVALGDLWNDLRAFETKYEDDYDACESLFAIWNTAFPNDELPALGANYSGEIDGWEIQDDLVESVVKTLRKYVIDQIYRIEEDHD